MKPPLKNLRNYIDALRRSGQLVEIEAEVDSALELPEIHRRIAAADGPALLFRHVKNSPFPVVTNLFGSTQRVELAFPEKPELLLKKLLDFATKDFPPKPKRLWQERKNLLKLLKLGTKRYKRSPVMESSMAAVDLEKIPLLKTWPLDGGHFVTLPLVYTEPVDGGPPNLGMYRIQRYDKKTTGIHWQIGKGGGFHYHQAEKLGKELPLSLFIGGPPALILSAIAPLPENVPELLLASFLMGDKLATSRTHHHPHPLISECEFALLGKVPPHERRMEGPFGDHYGYYSWAHDFPVFHCHKVYHRKDAIYPATVVGKPRQEDYYIGEYLQKLLSPLFPLVMPGVKDLWSYGETGFHSLSAAIIKERYEREAMASAFRILGEGQLALTKFLLLTDQPVPASDFKAVLTAVLERFRAETDLYVFANLSYDTLDYTGPSLNKGSRGVLLGIGEKKRSLPATFVGTLPSPISDVTPYSPGCLVLQTPPFTEFQDIAHLLNHPSFQSWPLLILVDDLKKALKNDASFLWTVFTRFEPAADIHAKSANVFRHHLCYQLPLLIDARMKPSYPPEVLCDDETANVVSTRWHDYFPKGQEMGESLSGHVC